MRIEMVKIKNYERLYVAGIKSIMYKPSNPFTILLGKNGSGKSSLLKEFIPNTEELNKDYGPDGSKELTYTHNGSKYILSYDRNSNRHSFVVDGEELNGQGLQKTQKILIEQHFKLTKNVHELLLSTTNFTDMSIGERKKWFTEILTTIDYTQAMEYYNNVKVRLRDLTSFIKLTQSKILKDSALLEELSDTKIEALKKDRVLFINMVDKLLGSKKTINSISKPDVGYMSKLSRELRNGISQIGVNKSLETLKTELDTLKANNNNYSNSIKDISDKLENVEKYDIRDDINVDMLKSTKESTYSNVIKLLTNPEFTLEYDSSLSTVKQFEHNYIEILGIAEQLANNYISKIVTEDDVRDASLKLKRVTDKLVDVDKEYFHLEHKSKHDDVTCPKCNNIFKPGYEDSDFESISKVREELLKDKKTLEEAFDKATKGLNAYTTQIRNIGILKYLIIESPLLPYIILKTNNFKDLSNIVNIISDIKVYLPSYDTLKSKLDEIKELDKKIELYSKLNDEKVSQILEKKKELQDSKVKLVTLINSNNIKMQITNKQYNILQGIIEKQAALDDSLKHVTSYKNSIISHHYNAYIDELIKEARHELVVIEGKLSEYDVVFMHKKNLEDELEEFKDKLKAVKEIEKLMSPTKGMIGESINKTINVVLERMNEFINRVWSYRVDILPCSIGESALTFRFPVKINNGKEISDVSKGSSSQKEMINIAFKLTVMEFLNMLDYPLILDEFGRTMDPLHRTKAFDFISELSKSHFDQVYLVSHFESMYKRFANTDVIVLDNENVGFDNDFNSNVKIN